eukprot:1243499-Amphidinium_carterae.1
MFDCKFTERKGTLLSGGVAQCISGFAPLAIVVTKAVQYARQSTAPCRCSLHKNDFINSSAVRAHVRDREEGAC